MKQLLISFIILILGYYPVYAAKLSNEESEAIVAKGEIISTYHQTKLRVGYTSDTGKLTAWVRYKGKVYHCVLEENFAIAYQEGILGIECISSLIPKKEDQ